MEVGRDWTQENYLENQRIDAGEKGQGLDWGSSEMNKLGFI